MPTYTSPFTGDVIQQTDVSYYALDFSEDVTLYWPLVVNPTQVPAARIMDCTPSTSGLNITLPNAIQGSVGIDILFRNFGSASFFVNDFDGGASVEIPSGESLYFYLSDNSTTAGIWQNVTFGAGTSSADAATLAGNGLAAISGKLNVTQNVQTIFSSPTSAVNTDRATTFVWTGGNGVFNLPVAAGLTAGWFIAFRNNGTGALNIIPGSGSLINNISSLTVNPGDSGIIMFQQSTSNFFTVGLATPSNVTFTSASYDVDTIVGPTFSLVSYAPIIQTYVAQSGTRTTDLTVILPATTQIYILANDTPGPYNLFFEVSGTSQPPTPVTPGSVVLVLSDGNNLYIISQSATTAFYANDGSAAAPTFSFLSDPATGMYLDSTSVLGFTANGVEMMLLDNFDPFNPQISTPATFTAGLISGGTF
ncbi:hypothetical protein UFOVP230_93 [uncultured Caudovirales phage]|uniref:Uncharacterized protein n=1 Tax=uncultured Caudovirales phage TaxID=2100421 RepID=A0A6J7XMH2_9CAUD|nr:hypothetical protein UFOVP230_93 [uncultured Caudovirales phage]